MGDISSKGIIDSFNLGKHRRMEYVDGKKLLPYFYDPQEILIMSTGYDRTAMTGANFLRGLYFLDENLDKDLKLKYELDYLEQLYNPIEGTEFEEVIKNSYIGMSPSTPIIRIPS